MGLARLDISLDSDSVDSLQVYCQELQKWNRRMNLVARNTPDGEVLEKHFLDSLTLLPVIRQYGGADATLLDVGTGAGFPGLALAAAMDSLQVTLVEPRQKRISFIRHIIRTLQLTNVRVFEDRLENAGDLFGYNFTFITSRAVADAARFLNMIKGIPGPETVVILMQAAGGMENWQESTRQGDWHLIENRKFQLPFSGASRSLQLLRYSADG
jgi:16S rRNA (guanine527-N7)-methyltransferase